MEELTGEQENSRAKYRTDASVKILNGSNGDLIGCDKVEKLTRMDPKKIGGDIRKWLTSAKIKEKIPGCAKFYPIFRSKK